MKLKCLLLLSICFSSCSKQEKFSLEKVITSASGDTTEFYRFYHNQKVKEVVYYKNNTPDTSFAFTLSGDTLCRPQLVLDTDSNHLFVFVPPQRFRNSELFIFTFETSRKDTLFHGEVNDGESIDITHLNHSKKVIGALYTRDIKTGSVNAFPLRLRWDGQEFPQN